ncbi:MAG: putative DNA binding domain-containing protein [Deltaproteobacteria bacterium]|jgi:predicted HTH transcriptional regulator|nr:putative DNA binding domain-containing protein [Deltaproteobacteria bacterium]
MKSLNQLLIAEATEYEFKAAIEMNKPRSWLKTVSAFANGLGGSIYVGVSNGGIIVGLANPQQAAEQVSELIRARIEPSIKKIVIEPLHVDGKDILRMKISGGTNTPYYYVGDGNKIAYYRVGNESVPAPAAILNELVLKGWHQTFDATDTKYRFSDYSYTLFEATYKQRTGNSIDKPRDYHSFGMLTDEDMLTFVGALFADQCPIYQSRVFCTRWNGLKKGGLYIDALDNDEFQNSAISLLNDSLKFVRHNSSVKWEKTGSGRIEFPDYPAVAVHEAVLNAIVHRNYMIQGSEIHIDMYDDRLEIVSPGGMPDGKRIQDLNIDDVPSIRRNPVICDIFSRLRLMERRGSGLRKIIDEYSSEDAVPVFRSTEQSFVVTLKNLNYGRVLMSPGVDPGVDVGVDPGVDPGVDVGKENNVGKILNAIFTEPKATQKKISEMTGLSTRTISRVIKELRDTGAIGRVGSDRSGYWEITKK